MTTRRYSNREFEELKRWLDNNQDSVSEKIVNDFIEMVSKDYPAKRIIATNSCMGALHIALQTIGVGPGDEVIVDPIVVFAGMAVMYQNAVPIFADIDSKTFNITPQSIRSRITPRTKAIICTHLFGNICNMEEILAIARENNLPVIEDCAHALFSTRNGKYAGLFGDFSAFSFNHRKQLSTGQGGFLLINSDDFTEKSKDKGFGRIPARLTWNYAMSGLIAGIAIAQWPYAKEYVRQDYQLAQLYNQAVKDCAWLIPQKIPGENWPSYHIWSAIYKGDEYGIEYKELMKVLRENGGDYFLPSFMPYGAFSLTPSPVYRYPLFNEPRAYTKRCPTFCPHYEGKINYENDLCPNAEYLIPRLFNTVLSPVEDDRVKRYADALYKTIKYFS
ncbi:MAG: DegT/DnrJ/EryC1/StrS family aminotransferase [Planctomycetota bacterium]